MFFAINIFFFKLKEFFFYQRYLGKIFLQLCTMDAFAVYLNPTVKLFSKEPRDTYLKIFKESIATAEQIPEGYLYRKKIKYIILNYILLSFVTQN